MKKLRDLIEPRDAIVGGSAEATTFEEAFGRYRFLKAIQRHLPEVIENLRNEVWPVYTKLSSSGQPWTEFSGHWSYIERGGRIAAHVEPLRAVILNWAAAHKLTLYDAKLKRRLPAAWVCETVAWTLWHWSKYQHDTATFPFAHPTFPYGDWVGRIQARKYQLVFSQRGPSPLESKHDFIERILSETRKTCERDWEAARRWCKSKIADSPELPTKRTNAHFVWFAQYQVGGWSPQLIAKSFTGPHVGDDAIRFAVREVARIVGLTPRAPKRGKKPRLN